MKCPLCNEELKQHTLETEKSDDGDCVHIGLECLKCKTGIEIFIHLKSWGLGAKKP